MILRNAFRFLYFLPRRVRSLGRTLLVWYRFSRLYHSGGMEKLNRFRSVRGVSRENLRRKVSQSRDNNQTPPPFYL